MNTMENTLEKIVDEILKHSTEVTKHKTDLDWRYEQSWVFRKLIADRIMHQHNPRKALCDLEFILERALQAIRTQDLFTLRWNTGFWLRCQACDSRTPEDVDRGLSVAVEEPLMSFRQCTACGAPMLPESCSWFDDRDAQLRNPPLGD